MKKQKHRAGIKSPVRPLKKTWNPQAPFSMVRTDFDDGCIAYEIWGESPDTCRRICSTYEQDELDFGSARRDAEKIVRALNLLHQVENEVEISHSFLKSRKPEHD